MIRFFAVVFAVIVVAACTAGDARPALPSVTMPDLSGAEGSVQTSIRGRYSRLQERLASRTSNAELANAYGDLGMALFAADYADAADPAFTAARTLAPNDVRWPYYLAHVRRSKHDLAGAAQLFRDALELQPDYTAALVWLGEMELGQGHVDAAGRAFGKAFDADHQSAAARYGLGRIALEKRAYRDAVIHLEAALRLAPNATRIEYPLGQAYEALGDTANAQRHLVRRGEGEVTPSDPLMTQLGALLDTAPSHERRGATALEQQQWDIAIDELRRAVALAPAHAMTRVNLGTALYMKGNADAALEQFQTAARQAPGLAQAHYSLGVVLSARGRDSEAIDALTAAVKADGGMTAARLELANALRRAGRAAESLPQYAEVLAARPDTSAARFGYAMALVRLGRYREARDWLDRASKTYENQPGFAHALARLLAAAPDPSVRNVSRAVALGRALFDAHRSIPEAETLAMAFAASGQFDDAVMLQQQIIDAAPGGGTELNLQWMQANLDRYKRHELCPAPWPDDDPVFHPRPADTTVPPPNR